MGIAYSHKKLWAFFLLMKYSTVDASIKININSECWLEWVEKVGIDDPILRYTYVNIYINPCSIYHEDCTPNYLR